MPNSHSFDYLFNAYYMSDHGVQNQVNKADKLLALNAECNKDSMQESKKSFQVVLSTVESYWYKGSKFIGQGKASLRT